MDTHLPCMDTSMLPDVLELYVRKMQMDTNLQLSFKILDNLQSKKVILTWKPANSDQRDWRPKAKKKSPSELLRNQTRKQQYLASRAEQAKHQQTVNQQPSDLQSVGHQMPEMEVPVSTPLSPHTKTQPTQSESTHDTVFNTPLSSHPNSAAFGVSHVAIPSLPSCANHVVKEDCGRKTPKTPKQTVGKNNHPRKDSLRSQNKNPCRVTFQQEYTIHWNSDVSSYDRDKGTVELKICSNCLPSLKDLKDRLKDMWWDNGMRISDGDNFTYMCTTCNQLQTISDKAILKTLK